MMNDWTRLEERVQAEDPWMASRKDLHILAKIVNLAVRRMGTSDEKENDKVDAITCSTHMSDRIAVLEQENKALKGDVAAPAAEA